MLRDTAEFPEPLGDETVSVFAEISVCVTDDELVGVVDGQ
jgi:hypothetical protein